MIKIVLEEPLLYNLNINPSEKYGIVYKNPDILEKINSILGGAKKLDSHERFTY